MVKKMQTGTSKDVAVGKRKRNKGARAQILANETGTLGKNTEKRLGNFLRASLMSRVPAAAAFPVSGSRRRTRRETYSPSFQEDLDRAKMASKRSAHLSSRDDAEGERDKTKKRKETKEKPIPSLPYPQIVWLDSARFGEDEDVEYEDDGKTVKRHLTVCELFEESYLEMKARAPDVQERTLYYLADSLEKPEQGNDIVYIHKRIKELKKRGWAFHKRYDIVRPGVHSPQLIEAMDDFRRDMKLEELRCRGGSAPDDDDS